MAQLNWPGMTVYNVCESTQEIYIFLINKVEIFLHLHRKPHENNHSVLFVVHTLVSETYTLWEINREIPLICAVNHETIIKIWGKLRKIGNFIVLSS